MKKRTRYIAAFTAVFVACSVYFGFFHQARPKTPAFGRTVVQRGNLEDVVTALGKLEPATYVDVGAQVSGQLVKLHVDIGNTVKKGELLAEIDPRTMLARVEADKATLAQLEASLAERNANLAQAQRNYTRDARLRKQNAASELAAQTSETQYKVTQAQVKATEAQIRQARATLESDELNLSYAQIYAPISGTVVSLEVQAGQTLNSNQTAPKLMRIADLQLMTVWASVSEADVGKIHPGMDVYFTTIGDSATRYRASVNKILPSYTKENDVIMYNVVFDVQNPDGIFLPAMNTQVFFVRAQVANTLYLPVEALRPGAKSQTRVTVLLPDGKEERREIALGVRTRTAVEVVSGLAEGEVVRLAPQASMDRRMSSSGMRPVRPRF